MTKLTPTLLRELREKAGRATANDMRYLDRFLVKVRITPGCWIWMASTSGRKLKYGNFWNGSPIKAHQYAYQVFVGRRRAGTITCHTCHNPLCVNPKHLYQGTYATNARDTLLAGRQSNGKKSITHCPSGHEYAGENLYEYGSHRHCRKCKDKHRRKSKEKFGYL